MRTISPDRLSNYARRTLRVADFTAANVALAANVYTRIGALTVPAGVGYFAGYGRDDGQDSAQGRIFMDLLSTAPGDVAGTVRLVVLNSRDIEVVQLFEYDVRELDTSATDKRQQVPFAVRYPIVLRDSKIALFVKSDTAVTFAYATSNILISMTICDVAE